MKLKSSRAHSARLRLIKVASILLHGMDVDDTVDKQHGMDIDSDNSVVTTKNEHFAKYMKSMPMDVSRSCEAQRQSPATDWLHWPVLSTAASRRV